MFHNIPEAVEARMRYLEELDAKDRTDGTPRSKALRQVSSETGRFIALMAMTAPEGAFIEIGTSAGYSTLWLALACRETGRRITTFEVSEEKTDLATTTFRLTGFESTVRCMRGDAREYIHLFDRIAFCFLDSEKDTYSDCYEAIIPRMVRGGLCLADNVLSHREALGSFTKGALLDKRVDALVVPIGTGLLVCRKA